MDVARTTGGLLPLSENIERNRGVIVLRSKAYANNIFISRGSVHPCILYQVTLRPSLHSNLHFLSSTYARGVFQCRDNMKGTRRLINIPNAQKNQTALVTIKNEWNGFFFHAQKVPSCVKDQSKFSRK